MWSGLVRIIAIDYDRYYIYSHCRHGTNERKYVPLESYKRF